MQLNRRWLLLPGLYDFIKFKRGLTFVYVTVCTLGIESVTYACCCRRAAETGLMTSWWRQKVCGTHCDSHHTTTTVTTSPLHTQWTILLNLTFCIFSLTVFVLILFNKLLTKWNVRAIMNPGQASGPKNLSIVPLGQWIGFRYVQYPIKT